jgi:diguanylate cyclase (GGDEF)-like protein/PAS domain S-box-containing protein
VPERSRLKKFPWQPVLVFTLLTAGLLSLAYFYTAQFKDFSRRSKENELRTVADLKALQVSSWRRERLATATNVFDSGYFAEKVRSLLKKPGSAEIMREIRSGLAHLHRNFPGEYSRIAIILPGPKVLFSDPEFPPFRPTPESLKLGLEASTTGGVIFGDLHRDPGTERISLLVAIPLAAARDRGKEPIASLILEIDPAVTLFPLVEEGPSTGPTSEVLLIERKGKDFLYLSEPRFQKGVALKLFLPISRFRRPGVEMPIGEEGTIEGLDYRKHRVIGVIRSVPDSPWLVEAKADAAEVAAGWSRWIGLISIVIVVFVLAAGAGLSLFWRRQKATLDADERQRWERALKNQNDFLRVMIDVMPNAAYLKDAEGRFIVCNAAFEKLVGLSMDRILGKTYEEISSKEAAGKDRETDGLLFEKPGVQVYEAPLKAWDGLEHHVIFIKSTFARPDGRTGGLICTMIDITQRKRAEEELQQLKKFSDSIVQTMSEGLVLTDSEGRFSFVNPAAAAILGYTPGEMVEREVISFVPKDRHSVVREADERRAKGIADRYELEFLHKDGRRKTILVSGGPRFAGTQYSGTMAVLTDITERKSMEEEIRALSLTDPLTNLYNRHGFQHLAEQQLKIAARINKRVFLLYADVDDLKRINDTFGHKEGDRVLADVATILKKSFRDSDILARIGGDEFVVLAMEAAKVSSEVFTRRLEEKLDLYNSRPEILGRYLLALSVGVSTYDPEFPTPIEELLSRADGLMYERKRAKKV